MSWGEIARKNARFVENGNYWWAGEGNVPSPSFTVECTATYYDTAKASTGD
jgi:hypothetical protein